MNDQQALAEEPPCEMECRVCRATVETSRNDGPTMPEGWGFVLVWGRCADGLPGLEP